MQSFHRSGLRPAGQVFSNGKRWEGSSRQRLLVLTRRFPVVPVGGVKCHSKRTLGCFAQVFAWLGQFTTGISISVLATNRAGDV